MIKNVKKCQNHAEWSIDSLYLLKRTQFAERCYSSVTSKLTFFY